MITDDELLTAVRESFGGARLSAPLDATVRRGRTLRTRRRIGGAVAATAVAAGLGVAGLGVAGLATGGPVPGGGGQPVPGHAPPPSPMPQTRLAAWTVTKGPGQQVKIMVRELRDPAGLQRTLRADGVPVTVAFQGGELSDTPPLPPACHPARMTDQANAELQGRILGPGMSRDPRVIALVIRAAQIPRGIGLNLTVQSHAAGYGWSLGLVQASPACTGS
jgi:hypothetical protein